MRHWKDGGHDSSGPTEEDGDISQAGDTHEAGPQVKQILQWSREDGFEVMDILLDISRWLQAMEEYISSYQETETVHRTWGATQVTSVGGSNLPATIPTQDTSEAVCLKHL